MRRRIRHAAILTARGHCGGRGIFGHQHAQIPDQQKHYGRLRQTGGGLCHAGPRPLLDKTLIAGECYRRRSVLGFKRPLGARSLSAANDTAGPIRSSPNPRRSSLE